MGTIRYNLRINKADKNGLCPIELIYQIAGFRKHVRTKEKLLPANWIQKQQLAVYLDRRQAKTKFPKDKFPLFDFDSLPLSKEIDAINNRLAAYRKEIAEIEKKFELEDEIYTPDEVIDLFINKEKAFRSRKSAKASVYTFIDSYITDHEATRKKGSLQVYKSLKKHLENFEEVKKVKVTFAGLDYTFFLEFQNFLLSPRRLFIPSKSKKSGGEGKVKTISLNNTTVAKQLTTLKTFINYARLQGIKVNDKYKDFKVKKENHEVITLTSEEFERLYNIDLATNKKLDQVRDVFCFSCATGLRYSDLDQLDRVHITNEEIKLVVTKTSKLLTIPLNPYSRAILSKYKSALRPLPVISNQKMNNYIKDLCKLAEINEPVEIVRFRGSKRETNTYPKHELITVHTGRKTFATLSLEKGMSAEETMAITGHEDYKSFKRYVNVTEQRKKASMLKAWGKEVSTQKLKAV